MSDNIAVRPTGWRIASRAWRSVFQAMGRMPVLFASAFVLFLLLQLCSLLTLHRPFAKAIPGLALYAALAVQTILSALVTAPVAVAVHRWVLLNDIQPGLSWKPTYIRLFFFWALALRLLYVLMTLPTIPLIGETVRVGVAGQHPRPGVILLNLVPMMIMIVASAYLALIFPDVAIGEPSISWFARVKASAARVRGNFWLLVRAAILAFLPVIAINMLLALTATRFYRRDMFTMDLFGPVFVGQALAGTVTALFSIGLAAATVSWLYSWVRTEKSEVTSG